MDEPDKSHINYRKRALETAARLPSLDDSLEIISPKRWLALVVILLILTVFVLWLFFGSVFIRVTGKGVLLSVTGDVVGVRSPNTAETIQKIFVKPGQSVKKDMVLMVFNNPSHDKLKYNQAYLLQLKEQYASLLKQSSQQIKLIEENEMQQIEKSKQSLIVAQDKLRQLEILVKLKESALNKGIIDLPNVTTSRIELFAYKQEIASREAELIAVKQRFIDLKDKWEERLRTLSLLIDQKEYEYAVLKKDWQTSYSILSPVSGVVAEIRAEEGEAISPGLVVMDIIPENQNLYALVFVPATKGKLIKTGMSALMDPTFVNKFEYGSMKGTVESLSLFPVTPESVLSAVKNQQLLEFFGPKEPLISVKIRLKEAKTKSGYLWTSKAGPDLILTQGSLIDVTIDIETKRPIGLLIRTIRNVFN